MSELDSERKQAIAKLIAQGKMTHEKPGVYVKDEDLTPEELESIPDYDIDVLKKALPDVLQMDFDEDEERGCFVTLLDGKRDDPIVVVLGDELPKDSDALIAKVHAHYKKILNVDEDEDELFDGIDGIED